MRAHRPILHLLMTALLIVPAVCCGGALESTPQPRAVETSNDCPGHAHRDQSVSQQQGCHGCALAAATVNSAEAPADDHVGLDQPDLLMADRSYELPAMSVVVGPTVTIRRYGTAYRPDTPVSLFDRLFLPS
jgi:hypothetical protein